MNEEQRTVLLKALENIDYIDDTDKGDKLRPLYCPSSYQEKQDETNQNNI